MNGPTFGVPRCGTASGAVRHSRQGEKPCVRCAAAKAAYDREWRKTPRRTQISRAKAKAQGRALSRLRAAHESEYRDMYEDAKAEVWREMELS